MLKNFAKVLGVTLVASATLLLATANLAQATTDETSYWLKIKANNKYERTAIEEMGIPIDMVREDYVISYGTHDDVSLLKSKNLLIAHSAVVDASDFPGEDAIFHNYQEVTTALQKLATENPDIIAINSIGKSNEGRDIWHLTISTDLATSRQKPGVIYMGGHHAREHLSIDVPLRLTQQLIEAYRAGDARIVRLIQSREIHMIPMVNPDGAEYDIETGNYRMWRKNRRRNNDGSYGVDLNRNYGFKWGSGGSSNNPRADTYMGPTPFSEPETQAVKAFIEQQENATLLLSFHTFSELILYPWGHNYDPISDAKDVSVFRNMAQQMSQWNNYVPQQASELYQASGDTTDWAYGTQHIFAFTFELDPKFSGGGWGFYPGASVIPEVVRKNWEPFLFMMEYADNPYRVLDNKPGLSF
jgi:carboxypeptidase T